MLGPGLPGLPGCGEYAEYAGDSPDASDAPDGEKHAPPGVMPLPNAVMKEMDYLGYMSNNKFYY